MAKNLFDAIASAAANITAQIKDYIETVALVEKDPSVPTWAKEPGKPTYRVEEIFGIAPVAVSNYFGDLDGIPDLTPSYEYKGTEFDTGRKWVNGETIYATAFELVISKTGVTTSLMSSGNRRFIKFEGVLTGDTLTTIRLLGPATGQAQHFHVGMDSATGNIYLSCDTTGTARVVAYYIKA